MDIQAEIDTLIAKNPKVLNYVEWVKYVPQDVELPGGTTHTLKLADLKGNDIVIALKAKPMYALLVNALLKEL